MRIHEGPLIYCIEHGRLYLPIEHYMVRKSIAESLQINVKGCWVDWLKTPQKFACKTRQRASLSVTEPAAWMEEVCWNVNINSVFVR